jgi:hypothetical protein
MLLIAMIFLLGAPAARVRVETAALFGYCISD